MKKNFFILKPVILIVLIAALILAGCAKEDNVESSEAQTESATEEFYTIIDNGKSEYVILRSERATQTEINAAIYLRQQIESVCGVTLRVVNDLDGQYEKAIIVGETTRESQADIVASLGYNDYIITFSGEDLIICGGNEEKTREAVEAFIEEYLAASVTTLTVPSDIRMYFAPDYSAENAYICNTEIHKYVIVVSSGASAGELAEANKLKETVIDRIGTCLEITTDNDDEAEYEIIIGKTKRVAPNDHQSKINVCKDDQGLVFFSNTKVFLSGKTTAAVRCAAREFDKMLCDDRFVENGVINIPSDTRTVEPYGNEYSIMSFNILYSKPGDRMSAVMTQINGTDPDLLGVQECSETWYKYLCEQLGERYGVVGELNSTTQRWRNAIFYKKSTFELIETKTQWLSNTPGVMSKFAESSQYRVMTYAVLKDRQSGDTIVHCNTHMDYVDEVRKIQFNVLLKLVEKLNNYPLLLTGDFNVDSTSVYYEQIQSAGYVSSYNMTRENDPTPTYDTSVIDFCFVTSQLINVVSHDVLGEDVNGIDPSDHNAVAVRFRLLK